MTEKDFLGTVNCPKCKHVIALYRKKTKVGTEEVDVYKTEIEAR